MQIRSLCKNPHPSIRQWTRQQCLRHFSKHTRIVFKKIPIHVYFFKLCQKFVPSNCLKIMIVERWKRENVIKHNHLIICKWFILVKVVVSQTLERKINDKKKKKNLVDRWQKNNLVSKHDELPSIFLTQAKPQCVCAGSCCDVKRVFPSIQTVKGSWNRESWSWFRQLFRGQNFKITK